MPFPLVAAGIAGAAVLGKLAGDAFNYHNQSKNLDWQKSMQRTTWQREDNAVQRRANDLKNAGLSQTLAAGNAAQTSAPVRTTAPQTDAGNSALQLATMSKQFEQADASIALAKAQRDTAKANTRLINNKSSTVWHDNKILQNSKTPMLSTASGRNKDIGSLLYLLQKNSGSSTTRDAKTSLDNKINAQYRKTKLNYKQPSDFWDRLLGPKILGKYYGNKHKSKKSKKRR